MTGGRPALDLDDAVDRLRSLDVRRVHVLAWRDLDDPEAGGSEVHADEIMARWAERGLDLVHRTSEAIGLPNDAVRNGYRVIRRGSRYSVFPRTIVSEIARRSGPFDALVEIWNGVPWFAPVWCRRPQITIVHHVHRDMWDDVLPRPLAPVARAVETRLAPPLYRRRRTVTPSTATRRDLIELGFVPERVRAVANGVDPAFRPGGRKSAHPSLVAVARLAPVKRLDRLIDAAVEARRTHPDLTLTIVGDGPRRAELEALVARHGAEPWIEFTGRVSRDELIDHYRRSWLAVSASGSEGWGLGLSEAAACGTTCVASDVGGHRDSVVDGETGVLAPVDDLGREIAALLGDDERRSRLERAARERATRSTWDATALGVTEELLASVRPRPDR